MKLKRLFYISFAVVTAINVTYGQQPYQLVDTSNKWFEYGQFGGWGYYELQLVRLTYFFNGDTTINGVPYKQLFHDRRDTIYYTQPYIQDSYGYTAAFRQDSLRVYFIMKGSTVENLYCDFDLSVGDTLKYYFNTQNRVVDSISYIPFGLGTRKRFHLNDIFSFYEGIGNQLGLFHDFSIGIEGGVYLVCFEQNDITQYVSAWGTNQECGLSTTTINEIKDFKNFNIFPNPFSTQTIFQSVNTMHNATLLVDNCYGQTVVQIKNISGQAITFNRENLPSGLYFIRLIEDNNIIVTRKIVITD